MNRTQLSIKQGLHHGILLLLSIILLSTLKLQAHAQIINIQPELRAKTPNGFAVKLQALTEMKSGNTDSFKIAGGTVLKFRENNHLILGLVSGEIAEADNMEYTNKYLGHLRYLYHFTKIFGGELFGQYEFDRYRRIDRRILGGVGPRITFPIDLPWLEISLGSAYMMEYNRNSLGAFLDSGLESTYNRWSNYLNLDIPITKDIFLFSTFYIQPRFDKFSDYRLLNDNSIELKLNKTIAFKLSFILSYDSIPPDTIKSLDKSFTTSLEIYYGPAGG